MEVMTKEEYYETMLCELLQAYRSLDERVHALDPMCGEGTAAKLADGDIIRILRLEGHDAEIDYVLQKHFDDAYDAFVEECEKEHEHIYEVTVGVNFDAILRVHAKDEDDVRDYINSEFSQNGNECYISDDSQVVEDIEYSDYGSNWDIEDISDTGEVWEEEE